MESTPLGTFKMWSLHAGGLYIQVVFRAGLYVAVNLTCVVCGGTPGYHIHCLPVIGTRGLRSGTKFSHNCYPNYNTVLHHLQPLSQKQTTGLKLKVVLKWR